MGRWSYLAGKLFIDWLNASPGKKWLDVGCGTGALSKAVLEKYDSSDLTAIDQSAEFVDFAHRHLGMMAKCVIGDAMNLSFSDSKFDYVVSGLVLNFIPDPVKALCEMKRVTTPGGTVGVYVWDYSGEMEFLNYFWDAAVELDPSASSLHEGNRFPDANKAGLHRLFKEAELSNVIVESIEIETEFADFNDYWKPFLGGQGPAPSYVLSLSESEKNRLRDHIRERLPVSKDGSLHLKARIWAAKSSK